MRDPYIQSLISSYCHRGILVDTNILLLFFVGSVNRKRISRFSRTEKYTIDDFELLLSAFKTFSQVITTPHILTEVYNFINQIGDPDRSLCLKEMAHVVQHLPKFQEVLIESKQITKSPGFIKFGLTDCGIQEVAQGEYLVLTDDLRLASYLGSQGLDVLNFNHIRLL
ncbi:MAG: hypothetical protein HC924_15690 [Synechococcaceae cyanobacterium SM2_3_2]|nr:hypothetical protein [Synechococcaceae cyanobacterium SM2_3_2]